MNILIGGSMSFADKMFEVQDILTQQGHTVKLSPGINFFLENPDAKMDFDQELQFCKETGIMKKFFDEIAISEAVVFLNYDKRGISGYIGASVLMEIGIAYYLGKKIFLTNAIDQSQGYALEVLLTDPTIINGDLSLIK
ncbi:MAG: hypothetical protein NT085_00370 [candidate division SR1 bacterium]|nr:hypothetical protein [candidate division SR1 bacterium]